MRKKLVTFEETFNINCGKTTNWENPKTRCLQSTQ